MFNFIKKYFKKGMPMRNVLDLSRPALDLTAPSSVLDFTVCPACGETLDFSQVEATPVVPVIDLSRATAQQVIDLARTVSAGSVINLTVERPDGRDAASDLRGFLRENRERVREVRVFLS